MIRAGSYLTATDPKERMMLDEQKMRAIQMKNLARAEVEGKAIWADKQRKTYANMLQISEPVPLQKIIADEESSVTNDEFLQRQRALANLLTIADDKNANYILDRLEPTQIAYMNTNFDKLLRQIKKNYKKLDKDIFISIVQKGESVDPVLTQITRQQNGYNTTINMTKPVAPLTKEGRQRQADIETLRQREEDKLRGIYADDLKRQEENALQLQLEHDARQREAALKTRLRKRGTKMSSREIDRYLAALSPVLEKKSHDYFLRSRTRNIIPEPEVIDEPKGNYDEPEVYTEPAGDYSFTDDLYGPVIIPEVQQGVSNALSDALEDLSRSRKADAITRTNIFDSPAINPANIRKNTPVVSPDMKRNTNHTIDTLCKKYEDDFPGYSTWANTLRDYIGHYTLGVKYGEMDINDQGNIEGVLGQKPDDDMTVSDILYTTKDRYVKMNQDEFGTPSSKQLHLIPWNEVRDLSLSSVPTDEKLAARSLVEMRLPPQKSKGYMEELIKLSNEYFTPAITEDLIAKNKKNKIVVLRDALVKHEIIRLRREKGLTQLEQPSLFSMVTGNIPTSAGKFFSRIIETVAPSTPPSVTPPKKGDGLRKRYYGRGSPAPQTEPRVEREYIDKYYVDMKKLKSNILSVKYAKTDAHIPTLKVTPITDPVKDLLTKILNEDQYDDSMYKKLKDTEKRLVKRFLKATKLDEQIDLGKDEDETFQTQFQILLGEFNSGNDSPVVKKSLKKFVLEGMQSNQIPRHHGMMLLYQLSL